MTIRIGINGLGRIGRSIVRAMYESESKDFELVAGNDLGPIEGHVHLLKYDSVHGKFHGNVSASGQNLVINGKEVRIFTQRDPKLIPWGEMGVDVVIESTGIFATRDKAAQHLAGGAKKVLISAPAEGADSTIVYGINNAMLKKEHQVISTGSCTTNALAQVAKVMNDTVGIEAGFMTTIHSYTGDQCLVDSFHKDLRRARAAALSMIPTSTGAAKTIGIILPELKGKLDGVSIRVPTPDVSLVDLCFTAGRDTTKDELNAALKAAASGALKGILGVSDEPLVSIDYTHTTESSIADLSGTFVTNKRFCRVASWYDNEWAFSNRMLDVARLWMTL